MATASQQLLRRLWNSAAMFFLVFEDADTEHAVYQAVVAKMRNMRQLCVAADRF